MYKPAGYSRAALMGLLFALVGFSYSLATSHSQSTSAKAAAARGVGSVAVDFTNPEITAGLRDLGDAVVGSAFNRVVRAKGGLPPYKFTVAATTATALKNGLDLALNTNGIITTIGTVIPTSATLGDFDFPVTVTDSYGTTASHTDTESFRIKLFAQGGAYRFAIDKLASAEQFREYLFKVDVLNGTPASFTVSNITLNGSALSSLELVGLSVANDGTIAGTPIQAGTLVFTLNSTSTSGASALSRSTLSTGETFTLDIAANPFVTSNLVATGVTVKYAKTANPAKPADSISYKGQANLLGQKLATLKDGEVVIAVGSYNSAEAGVTGNVLDDKGKTIKATAKSNTMKASINTQGKVSVAVAKSSTIGTKISSKVGTTATSVFLPVSVQFGSTIIGSELLNFAVKQSKSTVTLTFKQGDVVAGGQFLITSVKGTDDRNGDGDKWNVSFVALPAAELSNGNNATLRKGSFAQAKQARVAIGPGFSSDVAVTVKNNKVSFSTSEKTANTVSKLSMEDKKGKGSFQTTVVSPANSGLTLASAATAGVASSFGCNVLLFSDNAKQTIIYGGEGSQDVFASKNSWSSKIPK